MYAEVAIAGTGFKTWTYAVPPSLEGAISEGMPVVVPLRNRYVAGVAVQCHERMNMPEIRLREIEGLLEPSIALSDGQLALLRWLADYYICPLGDVLKAAFPPGFLGKVRMRVVPGESQPKDAKWQFVYNKIKAKRGGFVFNISKTIVKGVANSLILKMLKAGALHLSPDIHMPGARTRKIVRPAPDLKSSSITPRQKELIELLNGFSEGLTLANLADMGYSRALTGIMIKKGIIEIRVEADEAIVPPTSAIRKIALNNDQAKAVGQINQSLSSGKNDVFLLFGVTGSGKTEVYIEAVRQAIKLGKAALILLPEIALTPQAIRRFSEAVGEPIGLWHSGMSPGKRAEVYRKAGRGDLRIVIGVRSAVFVPLADLGVIIIDEEQDDSYKQSDPVPRYNARDVAIMRARIEQAVVVIGSATPSLESYFNAEKGKYKLLKLPQRYGGGRLPEASAIDLKSVEIDQKLWPLSEPFIEKVCLNVADGKQVIILLNRRGYSGILMCRACGYVALCPACRVAMTYHKTGHRLLCHYCGDSSRAPNKCPNCESAEFEFRGIGTQKLEELWASILGEKGILRMDSDTTARKGALEKIISTFEIGEKPILLGTRMVAKGHHFPNVGMVGVVLADAGLHLPDFRASEKVFQLLVQAAGRAGRTSNSDSRGEFVVQSFDPGSGILDYAKAQDYELFYRRELAFRRELGYPPYGKIIRLIFSGADDSLVRWAARAMARELSTKLKTGKVLGPAPTGVFRLGTKYHYQLVLKGRFSTDFKEYLKESIAEGKFKKAHEVQVKVDVDPREML